MMANERTLLRTSGTRLEVHITADGDKTIVKVTDKVTGATRSSTIGTLIAIDRDPDAARIASAEQAACLIMESWLGAALRVVDHASWRTVPPVEIGFYLATWLPETIDSAALVRPIVSELWFNIPRPGEPGEWWDQRIDRSFAGRQEPRRVRNVTAWMPMPQPHELPA